MATDTLQGLVKEPAPEVAGALGRALSASGTNGFAIGARESLTEVRELFTEEEDAPSSASMVLAEPEHRDAVIAWAEVMWSKGLMVEIADEVGRDAQSGEVQHYIRAEAWHRK